jgi:hypothetical protein
MKICKDDMKMDHARRESEELVSIFYRSIETAKKNDGMRETERK